MPTPRQIRAARALLDWNQKDLAARAGITEATVRNSEKENATPNARTVNAITKALAEANIEFIGTDGVECREKNILLIEDFVDVLNDAQSLLNKGDQILLHCADETKNEWYITQKLSELIDQGIQLRFTYKDGNTHTTTNPKNYRWIDKEYFANSEVSVTYADRHVVHVTEGEKDTFILIKNKDLARAMSKQFEYWWSKGKMIET